MEVSFEISTEKGETLVVSLLSSYRFVQDIINKNKFPDIEIIDISIVRKTGEATISNMILKEIVTKVSDILSSSPNSILFYLCDSADPIPNMRSSRNMLCQEYRDKLFNLMFERYSNEGNIEWNDYRIETLIKGEPQFAHLIYRQEYKETIAAIEKEVRDVFNIMDAEK